MRLRQRRQGRFAQLPQVAGQPLRGFSRVERLEPVQALRLIGQGLVDGGAEGVVVEAGRKVLLGHGTGPRQGAESVVAGVSRLRYGKATEHPNAPP